MLLAAAGLLVAAALAVTLLAGTGPPTVRERAEEVAASLACPVCQNLSVADSTSRVAGEMRRSIEAQLRQGRTPDEIRARFVASYGEWILLSPPARGTGLLVWVLPAAVIAGGAALAVSALRRWTSPRAPA
jgi:cytochrome c-type biogenesis protein CcmH